MARRADTKLTSIRVSSISCTLLPRPIWSQGRAAASAAHSVVRVAMKLQQYSGPVMAKGLEDTAFYRYNRLARAQ